MAGVPMYALSGSGLVAITTPGGGPSCAHASELKLANRARTMRIIMAISSLVEVERLDPKPLNPNPQLDWNHRDRAQRSRNQTTIQNVTGGRKARRIFGPLFSSAISACSCKSCFGEARLVAFVLLRAL